MMSDPDEPPPSARAALATKTIEARWRGFERSRDDILAMLQEVCEQSKKKSFDRDKVWRHLRFVALISIGPGKENQRGKLSAAKRAQLLRNLGNSLSDAHSMLKKAKQKALG